MNASHRDNVCDAKRDNDDKHVRAPSEQRSYCMVQVDSFAGVSKHEMSSSCSSAAHTFRPRMMWI